MTQTRGFSLEDTIYHFETIAAELTEIIPLCTMGRFEFARDALELLKDSITRRIDAIKGAAQ